MKTEIKFKIQYTYEGYDGDCIAVLGDSEHFIYSDLQVAMETIQGIQEHYSQYKYINSYNFRRRKVDITKQSVLKENSMSKYWFVKVDQAFDLLSGNAIEMADFKYGKSGIRIKEFDAEHYLKVAKNDARDLVQITASWISYEKTLKQFKIVPIIEGLDKSNLSLEFNT